MTSFLHWQVFSKPSARDRSNGDRTLGTGDVASWPCFGRQGKTVKHRVTSDTCSWKLGIIGERILGDVIKRQGMLPRGFSLMS